MKRRTAAERSADDFDASLYHLILEAERHAYNLRPQRDRWMEVANALRNARPKVRAMMYKADLETTT